MSGAADRMYARAERVFGRHSQLVAAAEECAELAAACSRFANGKCLESEVIEELADVELICGQLRRFFGDVAVDAVLGVKTHRFLARLDAIEQKGATPCPTPTPSGASAANGATSAQPTPRPTASSFTTAAAERTGSSTTHSDTSAPPPSEEPEMVQRVRAMQGSPEVANRGWSNGAALDLVAAYDAERAHHARTTQTLCTERAALTIERARVAKIAAILSDDTLEHPQKIGRALRVAEGAS